jgi:Mitochondrial carrier protein
MQFLAKLLPIVLGMLAILSAVAEQEVSVSESSTADSPIALVWRTVAKGVKSGLPGGAAGALQVLTLMWLRTIVNYQSRYGVSMRIAMSNLYRQGGIARFYQGWTFAMLQNPLSKFGLAVVVAHMPKNMALPLSVSLASIAAGVWRMLLTPLDTCKTVLQVEGKQGFAALRSKVRRGDIAALYNGAYAAAAASFVSHYPWLLTYRSLSAKLAVPAGRCKQLLRNAAIGLAASVAADVCSNSLRVLKTTKQASASYDTPISYRDAATAIMKTDGLRGLLGRGLGTRVLTNALQGILFTVIWRSLHERFVEPAVVAKPPAAQ